jgi:hypothetical protein
MMKTLKCPVTGKMACVPCDENHSQHEGWTVLGEHEGVPPEHAEWVDGQGWVVDEELAAEVTNRAANNVLTNHEIVESFRAAIADLQAQIDELKGQSKG